MTPLFHPHPVNDPLGDPAVYVDFLFERRALLFDLGDLAALPARKLLRISHVFVSHTHMDHFAGFDRLLRLSLGRERTLTLYGPPGFVDQVEHRLASYTWNLVHNYPADFMIIAAEWRDDDTLHRAQFRCRERFQREPLPMQTVENGVLLDEEEFRVRAARLDHDIPCLAFALEEKLHLNVWKNRLVELGLPTGPWLQELKRQVRSGAPDDTSIAIRWYDQHGQHLRELPLGQLKHEVLRTVPGQKIAYVVDTVFHPENARHIMELIHGAYTLFIETVFLEQDAERAASRYHLTAQQAGWLARQSGVQHLVPMHFSPRYSDDPEALQREAMAAFTADT
ncbi:MAG TPA: ribonuclease Z [Gammaproteobacteria bacterium]|nr:ribonuclease Z [Gammaproteobacteria bacterium]